MGKRKKDRKMIANLRAFYRLEPAIVQVNLSHFLDYIWKISENAPEGLLNKLNKYNIPKMGLLLKF